MTMMNDINTYNDNYLQVNDRWCLWNEWGDTERETKRWYLCNECEDLKCLQKPTIQSNFGGGLFPEDTVFN